MMSQQKVRILESYHKHRRYQENYAEKVHP
jgi:hypothetical protein